jgi:hypothetical protein
VWVHRYCGDRCLCLCMFTVLPFYCALLACPYVNIHMLRGRM